MSIGAGIAVGAIWLALAAAYIWGPQTDAENFALPIFVGLITTFVLAMAS